MYSHTHDRDDYIIYIFRFPKTAAAKSESTIGRSDREGNSIIIRFRGNGAHIYGESSFSSLVSSLVFFLRLIMLYYYICRRVRTPVILVQFPRFVFPAVFDFHCRPVFRYNFLYRFSLYLDNVRCMTIRYNIIIRHVRALWKRLRRVCRIFARIKSFAQQLPPKRVSPCKLLVLLVYNHDDDRNDGYLTPHRKPFGIKHTNHYTACQYKLCNINHLCAISVKIKWMYRHWFERRAPFRFVDFPWLVFNKL